MEYLEWRLETSTKCMKTLDSQVNVIESYENHSKGIPDVLVSAANPKWQIIVDFSNLKIHLHTLPSNPLYFRTLLLTKYNSSMFVGLWCTHNAIT